MLKGVCVGVTFKLKTQAEENANNKVDLGFADQMLPSCLSLSLFS